jgi:hypothetical protein
MQHTGAVLQKGGETPLCTLSRYWGATERGWGHEERATSTILCESSMVHTGVSSGDAKRRGEGELSRVGFFLGRQNELE